MTDHGAEQKQNPQPQNASRAEGSVTDVRIIRDDDFELSIDLYKQYASLHAQSDSMYQSRTNIITLTQGLLFVAFNGLVSQLEDQPFWIAALFVVAGLGCWLSIMWIFYEQRNLVFFKARSKLLRQMEDSLSEMSQVRGLQYRGFWSDVPSLVKEDARWFERFSAQRLLRFWVPFAFVIAWVSLLVISLAKEQISDRILVDDVQVIDTAETAVIETVEQEDELVGLKGVSDDVDDAQTTGAPPSE